MTPEEEIQRAEHANRILNDKLVQEALKGIRDAVIEQWRLCPVEKTQLRDYLHGLFNAAYKFEELLRSHVETGKMAAITEERKGLFDWLR